MNESAVFSRRSLIGTTVAALTAGTGLGEKASAQTAGSGWDFETDIICVGSGAAALTAATTALSNGDEVMVVERRSTLGGTTAKSGGVHWIPNNPLLRAKGLVDQKSDALSFMVRLAYPEYYTPGHPTLGVPKRRYDVLSAFYDNGSQMVDRLTSIGAYKAKFFEYAEAVLARNPKATRLPTSTPDYFDPPENKVTSGRALTAMLPDGSDGRGVGLVAALTSHLKRQDCPVLLDHRARELLVDGNGRVVGIVAISGDKRVRMRARKGVIFGTGGFAHNKDLIARFHRSRVFGSCAGNGSVGDFLGMASKVGAALDNMAGAWRGEVFLEQALASDEPLSSVYFLPRGDSMIHVNKYGHRVVSEYRPYQTRPRIHEVYDADREEYPNEIMIMIYDRRCVEIFGGTATIPADEGRPAWIISADTLDALAAEIDARLTRLRKYGVAVALDPVFAGNLRQTIDRFNAFARTGVDRDFGRGSRNYEVQSFVGLSRPANAAAEQKYRPLSNPTMFPIAPKGPYYAAILGQGVLDTSGGPAINDCAQVLDYDDAPIPGLYGAGNCIGAPTGAAYYGTGGTIGPAMTFGFIAANHAHRESVNSA